MVISRGEKVYLAAVYALLGVVSAVAVFPMLYVFAVSLTPYEEMLRQGGFVLIPRSVTLSAYRAFLLDPLIPGAYRVTVFVTVVGTAINLAVTMLMAYALSKKKLPGRSFFLLAVLFTMLFGGGIIPTYLIVKATGLLDTLWAMIIPNTVSAFNMLIMKTFFENLPPDLEESAKMDGAGDVRIFARIVIPLSLPSLATIGLFYAVTNWNVFFSAIMYLRDPKKYPLQVVLNRILKAAEMPEVQLEQVLPTHTMQMAAVILTALPILIVYPFIQKHFTQGVLLGSVKG